LIKTREKVIDSFKKMDWELFMKEDVRDLRAYLTSHVGSLNMRMITQGLYVFQSCWFVTTNSHLRRSTASIAAKQADHNHTMLELKLQGLREGIKSEFKTQQLILQSTNALLDKVIDLVNKWVFFPLLEVY
jgi:hypothetical protein